MYCSQRLIGVAFRQVKMYAIQFVHFGLRTIWVLNHIKFKMKMLAMSQRASCTGAHTVIGHAIAQELDSIFSQWRRRFNSCAVLAGYMVFKISLGQVLFQVVQPCPPTIIPSAFHIHFWGAHYSCTGNELHISTLALSQGFCFDLAHGYFETVKVS
jgi:hypothetical protein